MKAPSHCILSISVILTASILTAENPPFRILFSNDFTNITTCTSPYHSKGQSWHPDMLRATVDETAGTGIEVHMLQPAHGWVPWWQSEVYSMREHYDWWHDQYGNYPILGEHEYILKGGDPFVDFVTRCRRHGLSPFISLRMNDAHHLENTETPGNTKGYHAISRFYAENLNYRISQNPKSWDDRVQNWAIEDVRNYKFALIEEICSNYDIDGFEMDFMRHASLFNLEETTAEERKKIMTAFIVKVRQMMNQTAPSEKHRWLCVRIPVYTELHNKLGIDLKAWAAAGVDIINASTHYFTIQATDLPEIVKHIPDTPVYLEMCHATMIGKRVADGYDAFTFRRTTKEQYYTTAHMAYSRGAAGVSAFNFVYYREHGRGERGPFNEPPFEIFSHIGDPEWLAQQPQHYFLAKAYETPNMPQKLSPGGKVHFKIDMEPPVGGWKSSGKLRIQTSEPMDDAIFATTINQKELAPTHDISEPYQTQYVPLNATTQTARAWQVMPDDLKQGINTIEVKMLKGTPIEIVYVDLAVK
jgi:hypothetical protein